ncbi:MAG: hypothetical protein RH917_08950 [Lacipirellulaceae bacterium]
MIVPWVERDRHQSTEEQVLFAGLTVPRSKSAWMASGCCDLVYVPPVVKPHCSVALSVALVYPGYAHTRWGSLPANPGLWGVTPSA